MKEIKFALLLVCLFGVVALAKNSSPKNDFKMAQIQQIHRSYSN